MVKTYSKAADWSVKLAPNFQVSEFVDPTVDQVLIDTDLVIAAQMGRSYFCTPYFVGAGYRSAKYNQAIGGDPGSLHLLGKALDADVGHGFQEIDPRIVCMYYEAKGILNLGCYMYKDGTQWVHLGISTAKLYWIKSSATGRNVRVDTFLPTLRLEHIIHIHKYEVKFLQMFLNSILGISLKVDGNFGPLTQAAVIKYQRLKKLDDDGVVGPVTWRRIFNEPWNAKLRTVIM